MNVSVIRTHSMIDDFSHTQNQVSTHTKFLIKYFLEKSLFLRFFLIHLISIFLHSQSIDITRSQHNAFQMDFYIYVRCNICTSLVSSALNLTIILI